MPTDGPNPLTLLMPLREGIDIEEPAQVIAHEQPMIDAALEKVGTVHYARFLLLDASSPNLQPSSPSSEGPFLLGVITTYDGDFDLYIQDFVHQLGEVFDALLGFTRDGAPLVPVKDHVADFAAWVARNDASRQPPNNALSQYAAYPYTVQAVKAHCAT